MNETGNCWNCSAIGDAKACPDPSADPSVDPVVDAVDALDVLDAVDAAVDAELFFDAWRAGHGSELIAMKKSASVNLEWIPVGDEEEDVVT